MNGVQLACQFAAKAYFTIAPHVYAHDGFKFLVLMDGRLDASGAQSMLRQEHLYRPLSHVMPPISVCTASS